MQGLISDTEYEYVTQMPIEYTNETQNRPISEHDSINYVQNGLKFADFMLICKWHIICI